MGDADDLIALLDRLPPGVRRVRVGACEVEFAAATAPAPTAKGDHDAATAALAQKLGITVEELERATGKRPRPLTDVASLAAPIPDFEDDPLGGESDTGADLSARARAEFAAATQAPPLDPSS